MDPIQQNIQQLTGKKHIFLVKRGNDAIEQSLQLAWKLGKRKLLLCDQGGWLTYPTLGKDIGFDIITLPTERGVLSPATLRPHLAEDAVLLIHSLAGYLAPQDMMLIAKSCHRNNTFLINDATGAMGTHQAHFGDVVFSSFGKDKPLKITFGKAGFVACNDDSFVDHFVSHTFSDAELQEIQQALEGLQERLHFLQEKRIKVIKDLQAQGKQVVHATKYGLNVVVLFSSEKEQQEIVAYCEQEGLEYTICPREIRILENAISIEIKRL